MPDETWRQDDQAEMSLRERAIILRGYGEAGWDFGWDPYDLKDQFAHLGELVAEIAWLERDDEQRAMYGDTLEEQQAILDDMRERVARERWELTELHLLASGDRPTREQMKDVEQRYDEFTREATKPTELSVKDVARACLAGVDDPAWWEESKWPELTVIEHPEMSPDETEAHFVVQLGEQRYTVTVKLFA